MFECVSVLSQYSDFLCNCESGNLSKNCTCPHGYNMENGECSQEINACDNAPCMNGGGLIANLPRHIGGGLKGRTGIAARHGNGLDCPLALGQ